MSNFNEVLQNLKDYQEGPQIDMSNLKYMLENAVSMEETLISLLNVPPVGSHVKLVKRAWPKHDSKHYLAAGNTGTVVRLDWVTNGGGKPYFGVGYKPDCEWRYNEGKWLDQKKYLYPHEAPGPIHRVRADMLEVIPSEESLTYACYCTTCGWHGKAIDTHTGNGNYTLCPSCQSKETYRKDRTLRFSFPDLIPGYEELDR